MAGKYYSMQEVMEKLGKSEEQIKDLVREGKLRQYLDKGNPLFDPSQVDALSADQQGLLDLTAAGTDFDIQLEETAQINLEPDEEKTPPAGSTPESEGGFGLSMAGDKLTSDDTKASTFGINILDETDDGYKLSADSQGETRAGEMEEIESLDADANLESIGSGSGLLDLSLQADDTSLGAVLDDILPGGEGPAPDLGGGIGLTEEADAGAGLLDEIQEVQEEAPVISHEEVPVLAAEPVIPAGPGAQFMPVVVDSSTAAYGIAMFIPFAAVLIAAIALGAGLRGIRPGFLSSIAGSQFLLEWNLFWWITIGMIVLTLLLLVILLSALGEKTPKPARAAAAKAAKKPKKVKTKKK